ncbi:MAG TPA: hypothetical protein VKZ43_03255, partial [Trueperaceae bacterium]|nr:hypothetical protein [Trueperaceae bacterium]
MHSAHVMLVDPAGQRVALVAEGGVLSLPKVIATGTEGVDLPAAVGVSTPPTDGEALPAWIAKCAPVTVLASLAEVKDETAGEKSTVALYLCELGPAATLSDMADGWWTAGEDDLPDLPAALNAALRFTLSILEHGDAADGPWSFFNLPGTTAALAAILQATPAAAAVATMRVGSADVRATDLRQLRGWWLSSVWHNDDVVFKVTHPNWHAEPAVNELLGSWRPEHVETLVASGFHTAPGHRPTPWLLQRRIKARPRDQDQDPDTAQAEQLRLSVATVAALARIQLTCQGREAELLAAGVADRFLDATRAALPRLWAAEELASLEPAERAALPLLEKSILKRLDALAELGTTPLLAHGDLHL